MEPAVGRILVFLPAGGTHSEPSHHRPFAVVRHSANDRQSRPAIRAVKKRIPVASVLRIEAFRETLGTGRHIGGDGDHAGQALIAGLNAKPDFADCRLCVPRDPFDLRQGGRSSPKLSQKPVERPRLSFDFDQNGPGVILDESVQVQSRGKSKNKGTKPHPLDDPPHRYRSTFHEGAPRCSEPDVRQRYFQPRRQ